MATEVGSIAVAVVPSAKNFTERMRATLLPQADALGREVGDRLRAGVDAKLRDVKLGVKADTAKANAELDKTKLKADELGKKDEKIKVNVDNGGGVMSWLVSAVAAATAIAPAFAVAGVGVGAFAALAVPSLRAVTTYTRAVASGSSKASAEWAKMTTTQRAMAAGVMSLGNEFHHLSSEINPQTMQVFESAISDIDRILPEVVPLAKSAGNAIAGMFDSIGNALTGSQAQQFFAFVAKNIGPDMQQIDIVVVALVHTFMNLVEALQPTSLMLLHLVAGFADLLSWVSKVAPPLDSVIVLAIALYKPLRALKGLNLVETFAWLPQAATWMKDFMVATEGATVAERAQLATSIALDAVNPWVLAGAGVVAIGALTYVLLKNTTTMNGYIDTLRKQNDAMGWNVQGYRDLAAATDNAGKNAAQLNKAEQDSVPTIESARFGSVTYARAVGEVNQAHIAAAQSAKNLDHNLYMIQGQFGLTRSQAIALAKAAGVSAKELTGNGATAQEAMRKIEAYGNGERSATGITNALSLAVQSLTSAMQTNISAVLTLQGDEVGWRQAQQNATKAIDANKNSLDGNSASALAARQAIIQATSAVVQFASDQLKLHGNLHQASNEIQSQIKWLEQHAGKSKIARQEIHALRMEEAKIKAEIRSRIDITGSGRWSLQGGAMPFTTSGNRSTTGLKAAASGLLVPGIDHGYDSQLILARPGELVVPVSMVQAGEVNHLKGRIPGFAQGGVVGSYAGTIPGETNWLAGNLAGTFDSFAASLAGSFANAMSAGVPGGGHGNRGAEPWLSSLWIGAGGPPAMAHLMAAIAMAESGGNPMAYNPSGASGLWQILGAVNPADQSHLFSPAVNAIEAVLKWRSQGLGAWETFTNGAYRAFYDSGGWLPPGAIALNASGHPEPILSDAQWQMLSSAASGGDGAAVTEYHAHFDGASTMALQSNVRTAFRAMEMQNTLRQRVGRRR